MHTIAPTIAAPRPRRRPRQRHAAALALLLALPLCAQATPPAAAIVDAPLAEVEASADAHADTVADAVADVGGSAAAPEATPTCIEPRRLSGGFPRYPVDAVRNRVQGEVRVHAEINAEGRVTLAEPIDGPRLLRHAAADFIRSSTYSPKTCDGVPVATTTESLVEFSLSWMRR